CDPHGNSKPKQHTPSYSYTKVSPDAPTAADSSAAPDASAASAVATAYSSATSHAASSPYTAADSIFSAPYPGASAVGRSLTNLLSEHPTRCPPGIARAAAP